MSTKTTPVLLLTGYLGSGKTTLLNHILRNERNIRFAVIVNDIGEVNIDEKLIQKDGIVGQDASAGDLVALSNGCICCTLQTDLIRQLTDLTASGRFDYIVIEASGICEPAPIARTIDAITKLSPDNAPDGLPALDCVATVVDALRLKDEFGSGDSLRADNIDEEDIENLIIEQIEFCNLIILNKISEVTPYDAEHIKAVIRALQPKARIIETDYCDVNLDDIINTGLFNFEKVATSATWVEKIEGRGDDDDDDHDDDHDHDRHDHHDHHDHDHHHHHHHDEGEAEEYGIGTMVYYRRAPFNFERFDDMLARRWPRDIIRAKGILYFSQNRSMSLLFETAGRQMKVTEAGLWYATAPKEELEQLMASEPTLVRDWDEHYGDRMDKIVIIGQNLDRGNITRMLDDCLEAE